MLLEHMTAVLLFVTVPILSGMLIQWAIFRVRRSFPWKKQPEHTDTKG